MNNTNINYTHLANNSILTISWLHAARLVCNLPSTFVFRNSLFILFIITGSLISILIRTFYINFEVETTLYLTIVLTTIIIIGVLFTSYLGFTIISRIAYSIVYYSDLMQS